MAGFLQTEAEKQTITPNQSKENKYIFQLMYSNNKLPRGGEIVGALPLSVINKPKKRVISRPR